MWARPNGDVLERGKMIKPGTGLVTTYEELWRDLEVEVVGQEKTCTSVVLRAQDDGKGLRGMVIRVGGWCQGILKVGNDVTIERWQWVRSTSKLGRDTGGVGIDNNQPYRTRDRAQPSMTRFSYLKNRVKVTGSGLHDLEAVSCRAQSHSIWH